MGLFSEGSYGQVAMDMSKDAGKTFSEGLGGMMGVKTKTGEIKRILGSVDPSDQDAVQAAYKELIPLDGVVAKDFINTAMENLKTKSYAKSIDVQSQQAEYQLSEQALKKLRIKNTPILDKKWEKEKRTGAIQGFLQGMSIYRDPAAKEAAKDITTQAQAVSWIYKWGEKAGASGGELSAHKSSLKDTLALHKQNYISANYEREDLKAVNTSYGGELDGKVSKLLDVNNPPPAMTPLSNANDMNEAGTTGVNAATQRWNTSTDVTNMPPSTAYTDEEIDTMKLNTMNNYLNK